MIEYQPRARARIGHTAHAVTQSHHMRSHRRRCTAGATTSRQVRRQPPGLASGLEIDGVESTSEEEQFEEGWQRAAQRSLGQGSGWLDSDDDGVM